MDRSLNELSYNHEHCCADFDLFGGVSCCGHDCYMSPPRPDCDVSPPGPDCDVSPDLDLTVTCVYQDLDLTVTIEQRRLLRRQRQAVRRRRRMRRFILASLASRRNGRTSLYCLLNQRVPLLTLYFDGHSDLRPDFRLTRNTIRNLLEQLTIPNRQGWAHDVETLVFLFGWQVAPGHLTCQDPRCVKSSTEPLTASFTCGTGSSGFHLMMTSRSCCRFSTIGWISSFQQGGGKH
ncbi:hypothetical protein WMY93_027661 [Mugilogobius chulae]|uniref:Uncharacterized protein n=1 Tax=Mugilogobius chulae TaxID=88201 RepID=A0AAW0N3T0_9GOBI